MKNICLFIVNLFLIIFGMLVSGCAPAMFTGFATSTYTIAKDQSINQSVNDLRIATAIKARLIKNALYSRVNVEVSNGRVLFVGKVRKETDIATVLNIAWEQSGVKEVINELEADPYTNTGFAEYSQDTWITTTIKSKLLTDKDIKSVNYIILTVDGAVYILGQARSERELKKVAIIAAGINGVKKVVDHSIIINR